MKYISFTLIAVVLFSCSELTKKRKIEPLATGKPGQILTICTDELWTSKDLDTLITQIATPEEPYYPVEYQFKFNQKNVTGFNSTFRTTRNILIIERHNNAKYSPATINIIKDKWAKGQVVVEVFFQDISDLHNLSAEEIKTITDAFNEGEINRFVNHYVNKENKELKNRLKYKYEIELSIPLGVTVVNDMDDFLRLDVPDRSRDMTLDAGNFQKNNSNFILSYILMWQRDNADSSFFTREGLLQHQDSILKKYAPHEKKGAYLATEYDTLVNPIAQQIEVRGIKIIEIKGQYRIGGRSDVFMGGPFISYSFVNSKTNKIVTIFGMVHGPSEPLINYIREHKALIRTLKM